MVVFQAAAFKQQHYLLPTLPASSMLAGYWLDIKLPALGETLNLIISWLRVRWKYLALSVLITSAIGGYIVSLPFVTALAGIRVPLNEGVITGASLTLLAVAVGCMIHAFRMHRAWLFLLSLWFGLSVFFLGIVVSGEIVTALKLSPLPLVKHILHDLPSNESITLRNVFMDKLVLFYFPDPDRIHVTPDGTPMPKAFASGYYLFSQKEFDNIRKVMPKDVWEKIWVDLLNGRDKPETVVMVRKSVP
jgi:4-amino-4-deoxy-L-arabinose transferase-like glycosyltransferase